MGPCCRKPVSPGSMRIPMSAVLSSIDRIAPTRRPSEWAIGYHRWSNLLFVHWRVPASELAPLVPPQLTIDTFDGTAWIALVPFTLTGVRPWWSPPVWGISSFHETNVRTYVHHEGRDPGVWFFSLDASSSLAVRAARWKWRLPYYRASMSLKRFGTRVSYSSRRLWPGISGPGAEVEAEIGELIDNPESGLPAGRAAPGTLEHFLCERYILYSAGAGGALYQGYVHHSPYPLRECRVTCLRESLVQAAGVKVSSAPEHTVFSDHVSVEVFRLRPV